MSVDMCLGPCRLQVVTASELPSLAAGAVQAESSALPDPDRMILGHQLECHSATHPGLEPDNVDKQPPFLSGHKDGHWLYY